MDQSYPNAIQLTVADVKKSIKFYSEKLGFTLRQTFPDPKKPVWASLELGRQVVMLGANLGVEDAKKLGMDTAELDRVRKDSKAFAKSPHGVGASFYIAVPDVDAHHKNAKRRRVEVLAAPKTQFYGLREYVAHDPDGYRFVFYTRVHEGAEGHDGAQHQAGARKKAGAAREAIAGA